MGSVVEAVGELKLLNFSAKLVSEAGTVKWRTHLKPFAYDPSGRAMLDTESTRSTASGVDVAVDVAVVVNVLSANVAVPALLADCI